MPFKDPSAKRAWEKAHRADRSEAFLRQRAADALQRGYDRLYQTPEILQRQHAELPFVPESSRDILSRIRNGSA